MGITLSLQGQELTPVLINQGIFKERSLEKIQEMAGELGEKTGVHYYVAAYTGFPDGLNVHTTAKTLEDKMESPWILLIFSGVDKQVDLKFSQGLPDFTNKDAILDDFVIPIIVTKKKGLTDDDRYEAALFNGSTRVIADMAAYKHVEMASIPKGTVNETGTSNFSVNFWKYSFYAFIAVTLFVILINRRKKG